MKLLKQIILENKTEEVKDNLLKFLCCEVTLENKKNEEHSGLLVNHTEKNNS